MRLAGSKTIVFWKCACHCGLCRHYTYLYGRRRTFFSCAHHSAQFTQHCTLSNVGTPHWLKVKGICVAHFSALISVSFVMSLLDGPLGRFPPVTSSPSCSLSRPSASSTSFGGSRRTPCASAHWSAMSGCLATPTPNTGYEPNFYGCTNEEHTPINLPDSHRSFQCRDDATIISTTEGPEGFPHSGASSSKQTAASRVPTLSGSFGLGRIFR